MCTSTYNNHRTHTVFNIPQRNFQILLFLSGHWSNIDENYSKIWNSIFVDPCAWVKRQWIQMGLIVITQLEISALRNPWTWGKKWHEIYISFTNIEKCTQFQMEYYCLSSPLSYYTYFDTGIYLDTHISVLRRTHLSWYKHTSSNRHTYLDTDTLSWYRLICPDTNICTRLVIKYTHTCLDTDSPVLIQTYVYVLIHTHLPVLTKTLLLDTDSPVLIQTYTS